MRLHAADARADADGRVGAGAQCLRRTQVIGMRMGFEDPPQAQAVVREMLLHPLQALGADPARLRVVVQHRVDHHGITIALDDVRPGAGGIVEEGGDVQRRGHAVTRSAACCRNRCRAGFR